MWYIRGGEHRHPHQPISLRTRVALFAIAITTAVASAFVIVGLPGGDPPSRQAQEILPTPDVLPEPGDPYTESPEPDFYSSSPPSSSPALDPVFGTCREALENGYGPYARGVDPEYDWYVDRDGDGTACDTPMTTPDGSGGSTARPPSSPPSEPPPSKSSSPPSSLPPSESSSAPPTSSAPPPSTPGESSGVPTSSTQGTGQPT